MPPEPTKARMKRRNNRKELDEFRFDGTHARELEMKRNRGEVSCAECRRLKIKCDKQIPCQSCQRRGCTALCPNGSLSTGQGTRFVLAATEHLHKRISKLSNRVRQLEDALSGLQAKHSTEPHPLLHADLISKEDLRHGGFDEIGDGGDFEMMDEDDEDETGAGDDMGEGTSTGGANRKDSVTGRRGKDRGGEKLGGGDVIDAFGTLSISQNGISRFFGPTGGSESLLLSNVDTPYYDLPAASAAAAAQAALASHTGLHLTQSTSTINQTAPTSDTPQSSSVSPSLSSSASPSDHVPMRDSLSPSGSTSTGFAPGLAGAGRIDASLSLFSASFPFTPVSQPPEEVQSLLEREHLPRWEVAVGLAKTYFDQVAWLFRGLTRAQVEEDMLPAIYKRRRRARFEATPDVGLEQDGDDSGAGDSNSAADNDEEEWAGPHDLSLLFMVFAIGALVGGPITTSPIPAPAKAATIGSSSSSATSSSPMSTAPQAINHYTGPAQAEHFYHLSRASLALLPLLEKPSIVTIQTLHLMSVYNAMSGSDMRSETSMELTWGCVTLAAHLGQTIGLHRDCERWGLSEKMIRRRRVLFWDVFVADTWQSLNTGRPPTFSMPYVDCKLPQHDPSKGKPGFDAEYEIWSFTFAAEVVAEVTRRTLTAEAPTYATIMELDRMVRDFPLPPSMRVKPSDGSAVDGDYVSDFQRCVLDHIKETILLYIHRSFFAQAIIDHPENPLKSAYAPSFLASYRASSTILKAVVEQFRVWPGSSARFWTMWTFAFTAAVVFGTVVTRGPRSPLAKSAMRELEQACVLFSKASMYSVRATKALPILKKLNEKAHYALQAAQSASSDPSSSSAQSDAGLHWSINQEDPEDELAIFAGHTRLVNSNLKDKSEVSTPTVSTIGRSANAGDGSDSAKGAGVSGGQTNSGGYSSSSLAFEAGTGTFQTTPISHPQPQVYPGQRGTTSYTAGTSSTAAPPHLNSLHSVPSQQPSTAYMHQSRSGPAPLDMGLISSTGEYSTHPSSAGRGSNTPEDDLGMDMELSSASELHRRWAGVRNYGPLQPPSQPHQTSMERMHSSHPYASAYGTAPEPPRRMQSFDWGTAGSPTGPTTVRLEEHPQHGAPTQQRAVPRISRHPSQSHPAMYASTSSYPNSSNESIELVGVPPPVSGGTEYVGGSYHRHQHPPLQHHHPSMGAPHHRSQHSGSLSNPQHTSSYQQHQSQHHQHHLQQPTSATAAPQYHSMYSNFGTHASSSHRYPHEQPYSHGHVGGGGGSGSRMTGIQATTTSDLADLGIASRDSRLDEKWSMFMSESGILEPGFRG